MTETYHVVNQPDRHPTLDPAKLAEVLAKNGQFLLPMLDLIATNAVAARIKDAGFPVEKDFDTYDFSTMPNLSKPKILELARCEWILSHRIIS